MKKENTAIYQSIVRLEYLINMIPKLLMTISEDEFTKKQTPSKWSKKEIIGHLIDSATNNHHRFVRAQFEHNPEIHYNQNQWNTFSYHQNINGQQIISFWTLYNKHIIEIIKRIPEEKLKNQVNVGDELVTLDFLIIDYVEHLEHHLKQVIEY